MGTIYSLNPEDWFATDGAAVAEQNVPAGPSLQGSNVVQIVGEFPWGAPNVIHRIGSPAELAEKLIGKTADPYAYGGVRALEGKTFGQLEIVRVQAAAAAAATHTVGADGYKADARYKGVAGNQITIKNTNNTTTFDVAVKWGDYEKTYAARTLANVAAINDPYVVFATVGDADTIPATDGAAVALSGGADGTPSDAEWTGGVSSVVGLRALESGLGDLVFAAEHTSAAIITALRAHAALMRGMAIIQGVAALGDLAAAAAVAAALADDRAIVCLHGARQLINGIERDVHLTAFAASVMSQQPRHYSLADSDAGRAFLSRIIGPVEGVALNRTNWITADEVGGVMLEALTTGGFKFHAGLTTFKGDADKVLIFRRRVVDFAIANMVAAIDVVQNKPGMPYFERIGLSQAKGVIRALKGQPSIPQTAYIEDGDVTLSAGPQPNSKVYRVALKLWEEMRYQIVNITAGQTIDIQEVLS